MRTGNQVCGDFSDPAIAENNISMKQRSDPFRRDQSDIFDYRALINNALRYGRNGSDPLQLGLEVRREGRDALVALTDGGPGIVPDQIERLLRPFERGDAARSGTGGARLGLAIVDRIARIHQGRLTLSANSPSGLRAELRMPAV